MRRLESSFAISLLYAAAYGYLPFQAFSIYLPIFFLFLHICIEGWRVQLAPLYPFAFYFVYEFHFQTSEGFTPIFLTAIQIYLFMGSGLSCLMPVAKLPEPKGPFKKIGVVQRYIVRRSEALHFEPPVWPKHAEIVNDLTLKAFYPANSDATGKPGEYTSKAAAHSIARFAKMPSCIFQHTTRAHLNALENVSLASSPFLPSSSSSSPPSSSKFPIILFSHGLGGNSDCYSITAEALASAGFVVFCPTHEDFSASLAINANGEKKFYRFLNKEELKDNKLAEEIRRNQLLRRVNEMKFLLDRIMENEEKEVKQGAGAGWPFNPPWAGRLDLNKIVAFGHSFGGATSTTLAASDSRIKCVVNHDGWMLPVPSVIKTEGISTPTLMTVSQHFMDWGENWVEMKEMNEKNNKKNEESHLLLMEGTRHNNYSDVCIFSESLARMLKQIGPISMREGFDTIHEVSLKFVHDRLWQLDNEKNVDQIGCSNQEAPPAGRYFIPKGTRLIV